jgi:hypothetical protein
MNFELHARCLQDSPSSNSYAAFPVTEHFSCPAIWRCLDSRSVTALNDVTAKLYCGCSSVYLWFTENLSTSDGKW